MPLVHPLELLTSSRLWLALPQLLVILLVSWLAVWLGSRLIERVVGRLVRKRPTQDRAAFFGETDFEMATNQSKGWTWSLVRLPVPYDADLRQVEAIINATGKSLGQDPQYKEVFLDNPYFSNVEELRANAVVLRVNTKIHGNENQWWATRIVQQAMKEALDQNGIRIPFEAIEVETRTPIELSGALRRV